MNPSASLSKNFIMEGCFDFTDGLQCNPISSFLSETSLRFAKKSKLNIRQESFYTIKNLDFPFSLTCYHWIEKEQKITYPFQMPS